MRPALAHRSVGHGLAAVCSACMLSMQLHAVAAFDMSLVLSTREARPRNLPGICSGPA